MSPTGDARQISVLEIPSVSLCWHQAHETHKQILLHPPLCLQLLLGFPHLPWWVCSFINRARWHSSDYVGYKCLPVHTSYKPFLLVFCTFGQNTSDLFHALSLYHTPQLLLNMQAILTCGFAHLVIVWHLTSYVLYFLLYTSTTANKHANMWAIFACGFALLVTIWHLTSYMLYFLLYTSTFAKRHANILAIFA